MCYHLTHLTLLSTDKHRDLSTFLMAFAWHFRSMRISWNFNCVTIFHFCGFFSFCSSWKFSRTYHKRTTTTETEMALNVDVPTASELFQDDDMVFPSILMGRENLKILASPGSESSGVSSLDAEEAKVSQFHSNKIFTIFSA